MPNWCTNRLEVSGDPEPLSVFIASVSNSAGSLDFERGFPSPANDDGWGSLGWRTHYWGTKWNIVDQDNDASCQPICRLAKLALWDFETAWTPPEAWVIEVSKNNPALTFSLYYDEGGTNFSGITTVKHGDIVASRDGESESLVACSLPSCEECAEGVYPWEAEWGSETLTRYCPKHALEGATLDAISNDRQLRDDDTNTEDL